MLCSSDSKTVNNGNIALDESSKVFTGVDNLSRRKKVLHNFLCAMLANSMKTTYAWCYSSPCAQSRCTPPQKKGLQQMHCELLQVWIEGVTLEYRRFFFFNSIPSRIQNVLKNKKLLNKNRLLYSNLIANNTNDLYCGPLSGAAVNCSPYHLEFESQVMV